MIEQDIVDLQKAVGELTLAFQKFSSKPPATPSCCDDSKDSPQETPVATTPKSPTPSGGSPTSHTFTQIRSAVIKWIGPLAREDRKAAKAATKKLLDKFTGGEPLTQENTPEESFGLILEYIKSTEAK